ncbi:putative calcium-binding protein CML49 [Heracleum sosnowskyi]|uniref:Calcium-binding protein CML49 n=1 Tax=Heracleum sosnowskyi TaxID=360622 RepID=A0AAD8J477_9APIA|nr:putative calcium-binding protein CML49 [Heracleum sosnowskyi]
MSGYPRNNPQSGYNYNYTPPPTQSPYAPLPNHPSPYASAPYAPPNQPQPSQYASAPYATPPHQPQPSLYSSPPYAPQPTQSQSSPYSSAPYTSAPPSHTQHASAPYASYDHSKPNKDQYASAPPTQYAQTAYPPPYGSPFAALVPSNFPPGTDPNVIASFQLADRDSSGFIDDVELQKALTTYRESFSLRTVRLLMFHFTNSNSRKIGPKEFTAVFYSLQNWRAIFEKFDRDRSGKIDASELREALLSLGFAVSPVILDLLVSKFDKTGGRNKAIEYDNFIECCLTVKGLTEKFKEKDTAYVGSATFTYESFMLTVLPFLIA